MKILITDPPDVLMSDLAGECEYLRARAPGAEIDVYPYGDRASLLARLPGVAGILTAFVPLDADLLARAPALRAVSVQATGYDMVDAPAAARRRIAVCAIPEYCTQEVADHTWALALALERNLKDHIGGVDGARRWQYDAPPRRPQGLSGRTFGLFGLGRIGRAVAARARAFGMEVLAVDDRVTPGEARAAGAELTGAETLLEKSYIISNHMNLSAETAGFFCLDVFRRMRGRPIFLNMGRGGHVVEADLCRALDEGLIRAAGLDVLASENPDLTAHPLAGRPDVILTPHAAFYSEQSLRKLREISCENLLCCLQNRHREAYAVVNGVYEA
ncbi:MAG: C-terminal binding protein [Oscillospiraceae bacterium]|jgi:D-3-phosphoglycerate dehydrogenase|nr:C-terminal binding protein [Oscillospiraceae bacterium]